MEEQQLSAPHTLTSVGLDSLVRNYNLINMTERIEWIDTVKGIGILLVLIGHCALPTGSYIYMFHMPLFYIVNGYLWNYPKYSSMSSSVFITRKFKSYLIPYLKISIICLFVGWGIIDGASMDFGMVWIDRLREYIIGLFILSRGSSYWMPHCSPIWFLTAIFFADVFYFYIMKSKYKLPLVFLCVTIGYLLAGRQKLPMNVDNAIVAIPFMWYGTFLRNINFFEKMQKVSLSYYFIAAIVTLSIFKYGFKLNDFDGNKFDCLLATYLQATFICTTLIAWAARFLGGVKCCDSMAITPCY